MLKWFRKMGDWALPPAVQGPVGLKVDSDFAPEPEFWRTLFGLGSDGKIYTLDASDAKRLRPVILRDPRAVRNEQIVAEARRRRAAREEHLPITVIPHGMTEFEPALPEAEILAPAPRPVPDWIEADVIVMPPRGPGDDGHDK
jgi:hypothetical protein